MISGVGSYGGGSSKQCTCYTGQHPDTWVCEKHPGGRLWWENYNKLHDGLDDHFDHGFIPHEADEELCLNCGLGIRSHLGPEMTCFTGGCMCPRHMVRIWKPSLSIHETCAIAKDSY